MSKISSAKSNATCDPKEATKAQRLELSRLRAQKQAKLVTVSMARETRVRLQAGIKKTDD